MLVRVVSLLVVTFVFSGCAVQRTVDSEVQSWSTLTNLPQPYTYRLELLPSQQHTRELDAIVPLAHAALQRAGLQRDEATPLLIAEINVGTGTAYAAEPWYSHGPWEGGLGWSHRPALRAGWMLRASPPLVYRNEVSVILRDASTEKAVYETAASNEDLWTDRPQIFGVLFDAALAEFPTPPAGTRQIQLPLTPAH